MCRSYIFIENVININEIQTNRDIRDIYFCLLLTYFGILVGL